MGGTEGGGSITESTHDNFSNIALITINLKSQ